MKKEFTIDTESNDYQEALKIWDDFCYEIIHKNRVKVAETITGKKLLECFNDIKSKKYSMGANGDWDLFRARKGNWKTGIDDERKNKEFNKAPEGLVSDGRGNARGISYLYVTTNEDTAISEIRPLIGDIITIATVKIPKESLERVFSFEMLEQWEMHMRSPLIKDKVAKMLMYIINREMSKKIDNSLDYLPLQFIIEYLKVLGYSAFSFKSSRSNGTNYILFPETEIEVLNTKVIQVEDIDYTYKTKEVLIHE